MSYISHLFGSISGGNQSVGKVSSNISFVPTDSSGNTINIRGNDAIWLGLKNRDMQKYAYEYCFPVASVFDRLAEYDLNGIVQVLRSTGKGKDDYATSPWATQMNKLFSQPNPMQSWEQFRGQQIVYKKTHGFCPVLPIVPAGMGNEFAVAMVNIPPCLFDVEGTKNLLYATSIEDVVLKYKVTILGKTIEFEPSQILILEDSFLQDENTDYILPQSRLVGLDMAVSNICAAMEADNVLLKKKGPLGFISPEAQKDAAGHIPFDSKDKDQLQNALAGYGLLLSQFQYVISNNPVRWNPMSFSVRELATKETVVSGEKAVCHRYGFPYVLYEEVDATFANGSNAAKAVYINNVIPNSNKDFNKYNKFFKAIENNARIVSDFSHLPQLQEDEKVKADAAKAWNEALLMEYDNNLITKNQWLTARGYDTIADGDKYKADLVKPIIPVVDESVIEEEETTEL